MKFLNNWIISFLIILFVGSLSTQKLNAFQPNEVPTLQLRFVTEAPCSDGGLYCATIQVKVVESGEETTIGTSGIFFEYNADALSYASYTSIHFDGSDNCIPLDGFVAWDPHGFDFTEPGKFNLVLNLQGNASAFSCPTITSTEWVDVGTVCFNVLDASETTNLTFAPEASLTSFNTSDNDGSMVDVDRDNMGNIDEMPLGGSGGVPAPVISGDDGLVICAGGTGTPTYVTLTSNVTTPTGYTPQWQLDGSNISTDPNFNPTSVLANNAGDYTLMYVPTGDGCESGFSNALTVVEQNCIVDKTCPTVTPLNQSEEVCNGSFDINALLSIWQNNISINDPDGAAGNMILSSVPTTSSAFGLSPGPTGVYNGDGCTADTQIWYAGLECNSDEDAAIEEYIAAGTFTLTIYPTPQAPTLVSSFIEDSQACIYSFETACPNDNVDVDPVSLNESCGATNLNNVNVNVTNEQGCTEPFSVSKPDCSACATCILEVMDLNSFCVSSTTYIVDIVYQFSNSSSGGSFSVFDQNNNNLGSFNYGDLAQVGPFDLDGGTYSFELIDDSNINCNATSGVADIPTDCVPECLADGGTVSLSQSILCASDLSAVTVDVEGINASNGYDTRFFITNASGAILNGFSTNGPVLNGLGEGTYCLYTVSFDVSNGIDENATTIAGLGDGCYDVSECFLFDFYTSIPILGITTSPICDDGADTYSVGVTAQNGTGTAIIYGLPNSPTTVNVGQESTFVLPQGTNYTLTVEDGTSGCSPQNSFSVISPTCDVNCDPMSESLSGNTEACAGTMLNLNSFLTIPNGTVASWALGNTIITNPNNVNVNTTNCNGESKNYIATYTINDSNDCPVNYTYTLSVFIYPLISGSISESGCTINLSQDCPNFTASWNDGTTTQNGFTYTAGVGTTGTVVFTINNTNAPASCNTFTVTENFNCADPCDSNTPVVTTVTDDLCSGANFSLNSYISVPANTTITWRDGGGITVQNPNNLTASNNSCTAQAFLFSGTYSLTENGCSVDYTTNVELDVYPNVTATVTESNCGVSVSQDCSNFMASWTNNGSTQNGFNYTATEGTSGTVNFTVTNSFAPDGCNSFSISGSYNCPVACEEETITTNVSYDRCAEATFSLGEQANIPNGATVTWRDGVGNIVSNPNAINLTNTTCAVKTFDYQATYTQNNGDCPINYVINLEVDIYPTVTATVTESNCGVSISQDCPTFTATFTNNGSTQNGFGYTATEGTSGTVNFTVTNAAAPTNCNSFSASGSYDCPVACEEETITTNVSYDRCATSTFSLGEEANIPNGAGVTWTDGIGNIVSNPNAINLTNTTCTVKTFDYQATYTQNNGDCPINYVINLEVDIYPIVTATVTESNCGVSISQDCPTFTATFTNNGSTQNGFGYTAVEGTSGTVNFTITNAAAPTNCNSFSISGSYDCPVACEEEIITTNMTYDRCSGATFSLGEQLNAPNNVTVTWKDGSGQVVANPGSMSLSNTSCNMETFSYEASYTTMNGACPVNHIANLEVNVYPEIQATVNNNGCSVSLTQDCSNFATTWEDNLGETGFGVFYEGEEGTSGNVVFTVTNTAALANCQSISLTGNYDCPVICEEVINNTTGSEDLCANTSFSLNSFLNAPANVTVTWKDGIGNVVSNSNNINLSNDDCVVKTFTYTGEYTTFENECPINHIFNLSINIYPSVTASLITNDDCSVSVSKDCPSFVAEWSANGTSGGGFTYTATEGTSGTANFTVTNPNAPSNCSSASLQGNFDCPIPCNNETMTSSMSYDRCSNTSFSLGESLEVSANIVEWVDGTNNLVSNPNNMMLENTGCETDTYNYTGTYTLTDDNGCPTEYVVNLSVNVYPEVTGNIIVGGECVVGISQNCPNFTASWSDGNQSNTGFSYNASEGTSGTVSFTISNANAPQNCGSITLTGNFDCPIPCDNAPVTSTVSADAVCDNTTINLNDYVSIPANATATWTNNTGTTISSVNNILLTNNDCTVKTVSYTANYTLMDANGCPVEYTTTVSAQVYPAIDVSISEGECVLNVISQCANITATWSDNLGQSGNGLQYTAVSGTSGTVTFTISNSASPQDCLMEIDGNFDCPFTCLPQTNTVEVSGDICEGTGIDLYEIANVAETTGANWYNGIGVFIPNASNLNLSNPTCFIQTYLYQATYVSVDENGCTVDNVINLSLNVHPKITTLVIENANECTIQLTQDCSNFTASWTTMQGESGNGFSYEATAESSDIVTFVVSDSSSETCNELEVVVEVNCGDIGCESQIFDAVAAEESCGNTTLNLNDYVTTNNLVGWKDSEGNIVSNPNNMSLTANGCIAQVYTFVGSYTQSNGDCVDQYNTTLSITVYPEATTAIIEEGCNIVLSQDCDNLTATWTNSLGESGNGFSYNADQGTEGTVTFVIESPNCQSIEFSTAFECIDPCGGGTIIGNETVKACSGETINLFELLPVASGVDITWTNDTGNTVANADALTVTNDESCETVTYNYTATYALTDLEGCITNHEFTIILVVYPSITAELSNTECELISIIGACPNYSITWEDSNGTTGNNNNYIVPNNGSGSVTFTVENGLGPDCAVASFTESYTCIDVDSYADLGLSMYFNPSDTVMVGDIFECIITITNNGPAVANNVTVYDELLDAFEFQDVEGDGVYTPAGYWILGSIPPNSDLTRTVTLKALEEGVFNFVSFILGSVEEDANPDNDTFSEYLTVIANTGGGEPETPVTPETPEEECEPYNCGQDMIDCISTEYASEICPAFCEDMGGNYTITGVDADNSSIIEVDGQCVTFMPSPLAIAYGEETVVFIAENTDGVCASLTVYINLGDCNVGPQAIDDFYSLDEGSLSFDPTTNDSNGEDIELTICGDFTQPMNGTLIFDNGTFTYTPNDDFFGTDSFSYFVCDAAGNSSFAMVYLEVPGYVEACEEDIIIQECTEFVEPVVICLDYCQFGSISFSITDISTTFDCTIAILDDLCFRYTPLPSVTDGTDVVQITGCSEVLDDCQTVEAEITIGCSENLAPIAEEDNATTSEEESIVITVLDNDEDPDGDPINVCAYTQPLLGMVEVQSDGTFIYYPRIGYVGSDSFTYTVCDINGASTITTVYVEVYAVEATCDSDQELCTPAFTALTICVDFCEDDMEIEDISIPFHCSIVELDDNCFRYTPLPAFVGTETIEVEGCNSNDCEIATITIEVGDNCEDGFRIENNSNRLEDISLNERCELNIPNVFTPNQDGVNDVLYLGALTECYVNMDIEFTIFTRTGGLVFAAQNIQDGILWRGENLQQEGAYFYRLRIQYEGETLDKTGFVEVRQ